MEDDNDIFIKDDITKAISFNIGIYGTTVILFDAKNLFGKISLKKTNFKIKTGSRGKYEVCW